MIPADTRLAFCELSLSDYQMLTYLQLYCSVSRRRLPHFSQRGLVLFTFGSNEETSGGSFEAVGDLDGTCKGLLK